MNTFIKWPGGKKSEAKYVKKIMPKKFSRFIEPFFGSGAVAFSLMDNYKNKPILANDINNNLMQFYNLIKKNSKEFEYFLNLFLKEWDFLNTLSENIFEDIYIYFDIYYNNKIVKLSIEDKENISKSIYDHFNKNFSYFRNSIVKDDFLKIILHVTMDKIFKIISMELTKRSEPFSKEERLNHFETGIKSGYYTYFRGKEIKKNFLKYSPINQIEEVAIFFFIREYCYGSMFRVNSKGQFNIPYGGMSYNRKNFKSKVKKLFSSDTKEFFQRMNFYNKDFREIMKNIDEQDFVFFDPPYDSNFSEYDGHSFGLKDHKNLADLFSEMKGKGVLIIKKTDYIYKIYKEHADNGKLFIFSYNMKYLYNVRGRNDRDVTHLLITNYPIDL